MRLTRMRTSVLLVTMAFAAIATAERKTPLRGTPSERLLQLASRSKTIEVIVGVEVDGGSNVAAARKAKDDVLRRYERARRVAGRDYESMPFYLLEVDAQTLRRMMDDEAISSIEENLRGELTLAQSTNIIQSRTANGRGYGGQGWMIAVIDTGVDLDHPFLAGRFSSSQACFSGGEGYDSLCPNGQDTQFGSTAGDRCLFTDAIHSCDHGTMVAGVAAGKNAGNNTWGVAPDATILPIQTASRDCSSTPCGITNALDDVIAALNWLNTNTPSNLAAINLSLGFPMSQASQHCDGLVPALANVISQLRAKNVAVVAGSGNNGQVHYTTAPACISTAISVGATADNDAITSYSNSASHLDLLAPGGVMGPDFQAVPGEGIISSSSMPTEHSYRESYGTSFASPHVGGAFAVLRHRSNNATVDKLLEDLQLSGTPVTDHRVANRVTPRINVNAALDRADNTPPSTPGSFTATGNGNGLVTLSWTRSTDDSGVTPTYRLRRRAAHGGAWTELPAQSGTSYSETVNASKLFQYEVVALDGSNNTSAAALDYAITVSFTNDPLRYPNENGGDVVRGRHVSELREASDAWREFAGLARNYASYAPLTGTIYAADFSSVISSFNAARSAMGLGSFSYSDGSMPQSLTLIRLIHVQQLRDAME